MARYFPKANYLMETQGGNFVFDVSITDMDSDAIVTYSVTVKNQYGFCHFPTLEEYDTALRHGIVEFITNERKDLDALAATYLG